MTDRVIRTLDKYLIRPIHYEGLIRVEPLEIPESALREAILNAIIHKLYSGAHIQMRVFSDRLELWNEGALPDGWTIEQLKQAHSSKPRNPNLARIFYMAGLIEHWGRGIDKIIRQTTNAGLKEPQFKDFCNGLQVTFYRDLSLQNPSSTMVNSDQTGVGSQKSSQKSSQKILELLIEHPHMTTSELADALGISQRAVMKNIRNLKDEGVLLRIGSARNGYWEINAMK